MNFLAGFIHMNSFRNSDKKCSRKSGRYLNEYPDEAIFHTGIRLFGSYLKLNHSLPSSAKNT